MSRVIFILYCLFQIYIAKVFSDTTRTSPVLIYSKPSNTVIFVDRGSSLTLFCLFSGSPVPNIAWSQNGVIMQETLNRNAQFTISNANTDDAGTYKCLGSNLLGNDSKYFIIVIATSETTPGTTTTKPIIYPTQTHSTVSGFSTNSPPEEALPIKVKMTVRDPSRFRGQELSQLYIDEGSTLTLHCEVESTVSFKQYWKKNEVYYRYNNRKTHRINSFRSTDEATYTCEAIKTPTGGSVGRSINVKIGVTIQWRLTPPTTTYVVLGSNVVIDVIVYPINDVTINWYTIVVSNRGNEQFVPINTSASNILLKNYDQRLSFRPFYEGNANDYIVTAKNQYMSISARFNLYYRTKITTNPRRGRTGFEPERSLFLPCVVEGYPKPEVTWYYSSGNGGVEVNVLRSNMRNRVNITRKGLLITTTLNSDDGAKFICNAEGNDDRGTRSIFYTLQAGQLPMFEDGSCDIGYCPGDERVKLVCRGKSISSLQYRWLKSPSLNSPISTTSKYQVFANGDLVILSPTSSDAGIYYCQISDMYGTLYKSCNVTLSNPPEFISSHQSNELLVSLGGNFRMQCPVSATRPLSIMWLKDGVELDLNTINHSINELSVNSIYSLLVFNTMDSDSGVYTCNISNCAGSVDRSLTVTIRSLIRITSTIPTITNYCENTTVTLPCISKGFPTPSNTWYYNSNAITADNVEYTIKPNSLVIPTAKTLSTGLYNCTASNAFGYDSYSVQINIHQVNPPIIIIRNSSLPVLSSDYRIYCIPYFNPSWLTHTYMWYKNSQRIYHSANYKLNSEGQMIIKSFRASDLANYSCDVTNCGGSTSYTYSINKYEGQGIQPTIKNTQNRFVRPVGGSAVLECIASGDPKPSIHWIFNGNVVRNNANIAIGENTLTISPLSIQHNGNYTCIAYNQHGSPQRLYNILVYQAPKMMPTSDANSCIGESACFDCVVLSANPPPNIIWSHNDQILTENSNRAVIHRNNTLCLSDINCNDSGFYWCLARNIAGTNSTRGYLSVCGCCEKIVFTKNVTQNFFVAEGTTVTLECPVEPYTYKCSYTTSWFELNDSGENIAEILPDDSRRIGNDLRFNVTSTTKGKYSCNVRNSKGLRALAFSVSIIIPPKVIDHKIAFTFKQGSNVNIACPIVAYPLPAYSWYSEKQGAVISNTRLLQLPSVRTSDSAIYTCTAINEHGSTNTSLILIVCVQPSVFSLGPTKPVDEGSKAVFYCSVRGGTIPTAIKWYIGSSNIDVSTLSPLDYKIVVSSSGKSGRLVIRKVKPSHEGLVTCKIITNCGNVTQTEFLVVQRKSECKVTIRESNVRFQSPIVPNCLDPVTIFCPGKGTPTPAISWLFNGTAMQNANLKRSNKELIIPMPDITSAGIYTCRVENECKVAQMHFNLTFTLPENYVTWTTQYKVTGESSTFQCHSGPSIPCWSKDLKLLDVNNNPRYTQNSSGELLVSSLKIEDSGIYLCLAHTADQTYSYIYQLYITDPPL